jgi:hypothetical protein
MRRWFITLAVLLALAAAAAAVSYCWVCGGIQHRPQHAEAVSWLRDEFELNDDQVRRIEAMHEAYREVCAGHCDAISEARSRLETLRKGGADAAVLRDAEARLAAVDAICRSSTEAHVRAVAAIMGPKQGGRYLEMVLPKLAHVAHSGAPDLRANSAGAHHGH